MITQQVYENYITAGVRKTNNYLGDWILSRITCKNKNALLLVIGDTGSGKSYTSMKLAEIIMDAQGKKFEVSKHLFFSPEDFIQRLNEGNFEKGDVIVLEEVGVEHSNRTWWSKDQLNFNFILQTFRFKNLCVIMNSPSFKFVDSQARELFHGSLHCISVSTKGVVAKFKVFERNHLTGKIYTKYLRAKSSQWSSYKRIKNFVFKKPSEEVARTYEKLSHNYKNMVIKRAMVDKYKGKRLYNENGDSYMLPEDRIVAAAYLVREKKYKLSEAAEVYDVRVNTLRDFLSPYKKEKINKENVINNERREALESLDPLNVLKPLIEKNEVKEVTNARAD